MRKYFVFTLLCVALLSCENNRGVITGNATSVTLNSAKIESYLKMSIIESGTSFKYGVVYGLSPSPTIDQDLYVEAPYLDKNQKFTVTLVLLRPYTTYYYRAFVRIGDDTIYGKEKTFVTDLSGDDIYTRLLRQEIQTIQTYIEHNQINIIEDLPADGIWNEKDYYRVPDTLTNFLFFHLVNPGDMSQTELKEGNIIVMRYRQITLTYPYDTTSYWTTLEAPYPVEWWYHSTKTKKNIPLGWERAAELMKYPNSECKIICPSILGTSENRTSVTPLEYHLKMKIKR